MSEPARGEVWLTDLDPSRGHEQAGRRPVLVVSDDLFNRGPAGMVIILPVTSRVRPIPAHVVVHPPEGGLRVESAILCDAVRSISKERLSKRWGVVTAAILTAVKTASGFYSVFEERPRGGAFVSLSERSCAVTSKPGFADQRHLLRWADSVAARCELPRLIRRLIVETGRGVVQLGFPAGEGVAAGSWDGTVRATESPPTSRPT